MSRLFVHVEGETEERFVNEVLSPHLYDHGFSRISARLIGNARQRDRRGGIRAWTVVRKDIVNHLREDRGSIATTMVDYYGLPQTGSKSALSNSGRFQGLAGPVAGISDLVVGRESKDRRSRALGRHRPGNGAWLRSGAIHTLCDNARVRGLAVQRLPRIRSRNRTPEAGVEVPRHPRRIRSPGGNR